MIEKIQIYNLNVKKDGKCSLGYNENEINVIFIYFFFLVNECFEVQSWSCTFTYK